MKTSFHRIHTEDGLELHGALYEPDQRSTTVVAHIHGMAGNFYENSFVDSLARTLTENGIAFSPFNNRGNGYIATSIKNINGKVEQVRIGSAYERFEDCLLDIGAHLDFLIDQGFTTLHLCGHSLGAPKAAYYLSRTQDKRVKSVILLSPSDMMGLIRADKEKFEEDRATARAMIEGGRGNELMPREVWGEYPLTANTYLNLFDDTSEAAIFNFHDRSDEFKTLSKVSHPILAVMGRRDHVLTIPIEEVMRIIEEKTKSSPKREYEILGDATHDYGGFEQELADTLSKWIKGL